MQHVLVSSVFIAEIKDLRLLIEVRGRVVVLNMASATTPGGGYRKGQGAQEENLFRRSNYCQSLDTLPGEPNPSAPTCVCPCVRPCGVRGARQPRTHHVCERYKSMNVRGCASV